MYKVYIQINPSNIVTAINSDAFMVSTLGWVLIDEGEGDKFHHAQGNYLPKPLMTMQGDYQYKLFDGKVVERTAEEIAADIAAIPPPPPDPLQVTQKAATVMFRALAQTDVLTPAQALENRQMFDDWSVRIGTQAATGEYLRYEDGLYRVQQEHPIQAHQPPSVHTAALYTRVQEPGAGPEPWVQGQSYDKDVEAIHNGGVWLSGVDNNVWEPGAAGVFDNIWKRVRDA